MVVVALLLGDERRARLVERRTQLRILLLPLARPALRRRLLRPLPRRLLRRRLLAPHGLELRAELLCHAPRALVRLRVRVRVRLGIG